MLCWLASGQLEVVGLRIPEGIRGAAYETTLSRPAPQGRPNALLTNIW